MSAPSLEGASRSDSGVRAIARRFGLVWGMPALLGAATMFGLLAALLGTGGWRWVSWLALAWPLGVAVRYWVRPKIP